MKKVFLITVIILCVAINAGAVDNWKETDQVTIAWDAVVQLENGDPIPSDNTIKYKIYLVNAIADVEKANPVLITETDQTSQVITMTTEGKYFVGVSTVRYDSTGELINESAVNWSDVNGEATPVPFGLMHYFQAKAPINLR